MLAGRIIAAVEAEAAAGDQRADKVLQALLAEEAQTGGLCVVSRLAASPHVPGDLRYERAQRERRKGEAMSREFTPEDAIAVAKAAGLDTTGLEEQAAQRAGGGGHLGEKIASLEAELQRRVPAAPASPQQQEQAFANELLEHLNASRTPWHETGRRGRG